MEYRFKKKKKNPTNYKHECENKNVKIFMTLEANRIDKRRKRRLQRLPGIRLPWSHQHKCLGLDIFILFL